MRKKKWKRMFNRKKRREEKKHQTSENTQGEYPKGKRNLKPEGGDFQKKEEGELRETILYCDKQTGGGLGQKQHGRWAWSTKRGWGERKGSPWEG